MTPLHCADIIFTLFIGGLALTLMILTLREDLLRRKGL